MTLAVIGTIALFASVSSSFPLGIGIGGGLIVLGAVLAFTPSRYQ
jgi:hypothetical protein